MNDSNSVSPALPSTPLEPPARVLFVCLGNICRSPAGEGVLAHRVAERDLGDLIEIDSAGTGAYHVGERADPRMRRAAAARGYELPSRARQATADDFDRFDLVIAMDRRNLADLEDLVPGPRPDHLCLLSDFLPSDGEWDGVEDVPDPYEGGPAGFERVMDMMEAATSNLLDHLLDRLDRSGRSRPGT